jgi:sec-independent protein translocase protein TatB
MLQPMFGIGGSEIVVILIVALLFLGPDKLPDAAKTISKGIRDLKRQSRALQQQIESDEKIGGAIRDLKSALRGEDYPARPPVRVEPPKTDPAPLEATEAALESPALPEPQHVVTLPELAGEPDHDAAPIVDDGGDIGSLIKPASGSIAKGEPAPAKSESEPAKPPPLPSISKQKHG